MQPAAHVLDPGAEAGEHIRLEIDVPELDHASLAARTSQRSAQSRPSNKKEKGGAEKPVLKSRAARSRAGTPKLSGPGGVKHHEGTGRSPGRSSAGGSLLLPRVTVLSAVGIIRRNIWSEAQVLQCPQQAGIQ
jgi:hypothetical protein